MLRIATRFGDGGRRSAGGDAGAQTFLDWLANPAAFALMIFAQLLVLGFLVSLVAALVLKRKAPALGSATESAPNAL